MSLALISPSNRRNRSNPGLKPFSNVDADPVSRRDWILIMGIKSSPLRQFSQLFRIRQWYVNLAYVHAPNLTGNSTVVPPQADVTAHKQVLVAIGIFFGQGLFIKPGVNDI